MPEAEDAGSFGGAFVYIAQNTLGEPVDVLTMSFGCEAPVVGAISLTNADFSSCQTCVLLELGCDGLLSNCEKTFLADAGTVDVASTGATDDTFAGNLEDVHFVEVEIDENSVSTPVPGGEERCWSSYAFSSIIQ